MTPSVGHGPCVLLLAEQEFQHPWAPTAPNLKPWRAASPHLRDVLRGWHLELSWDSTLIFKSLPGKGVPCLPQGCLLWPTKCTGERWQAASCQPSCPFPPFSPMCLLPKGWRKTFEACRSGLQRTQVRWRWWAGRILYYSMAFVISLYVVVLCHL